MRRRLLAAAVLLVACNNGDGNATTSTTDPDAPNQRVEGLPAQGREVQGLADGRLTACGAVGIDVELLRAVGGRLGVPVDFADAATDGCEVVPAVAPSTGTVSEPYYTVIESLLVREADAPRYPDLAALRGRQVGVVAGTRGAELARGEPGLTVVEADDDKGLVAALRGSRVDAVVHAFPVMAAAAPPAFGTAVTKQWDDTARHHVFVLSNGDTALKKAVDDALAAMRRDDLYNSALERHLGYD